MSISRRKFVKYGLVIGALASSPFALITNTFGQKRRERARPERPNPSLYFNKATFAAYADTDFLVRAGSAGLVFMRLSRVEDLPGSQMLRSPDECFGLMFTAPAGTSIPQETYQVEHGALGKFPLFLVPVGPRTLDGPAYFQAVFNRRSA